MVLLQGLFAYVRRSASSIVKALFGWAVRALFGDVTKTEESVLSGVVGAAAIWPLLLVGVAFPKIAAAVLAFVPLSRNAPEWLVRTIWIVLAAIVPFAVGIAVSIRSSAPPRSEGRARRMLRGFPITLGLASAFAAAFVISPFRRLRALARGRRDEHVPIVVDASVYHRVAEQIRRTLVWGGIRVERVRAPASLTAPARLLRFFAGRAFSHRFPRRLEFLTGRNLDVVVNPNGITLQGHPDITARAHALVAEELTHSLAFQTTDPEAQRVEKEIKAVWAVLDTDPPRHAGSPALLARLAEIGRELTQLAVPFDEWEVVYREMLQLARALHGGPSLLALEQKESTA